MKTIRIVKFQLRIMKILKNLGIPHDNLENHKNYMIPRNNHENYENQRIPIEIHSNHENLRIL